MRSWLRALLLAAPLVGACVAEGGSLGPHPDPNAYASGSGATDTTDHGGSAGTGDGGTAGAAASSGGSGGSPPSNEGGSSSSSAGGAGMPNNGPPAPSITITEYDIPTPSEPGAISAGPDGNLWFIHLSTKPNAVSSLSTMGTMFNQILTSTTNTGPVAISGGPDGNVWYTKQGGIGRVTPAGKVDEFGVPNGGDSGGICNGPDGNLWFTEPNSGRVARVSPSANFKDFPLPDKNSNPVAITLGPDGALWFTEASTNKIGRITTAGQITEYPIPTAASNPVGIAKGADGNLWFSEHDAHRIGVVTPAGVMTEYALTSNATPGSMSAGSDGNVWFNEAGTANAIGRVTPQGSIAEYPIPSAGSDPTGITSGPDQNLWFTELSTNKIGRISNLKGGGNVSAGAGPATNDATKCSSDTDCVGSGKACGGDVCSAAVTPHVCVLATTMDLGSCNSDAQCWCKGEGATCNASAHHCTFTVHDENPLDAGK